MGQSDSPAHPANDYAHNPLGQLKGEDKGHPLKLGHVVLQIPSSHRF